MSKQERIGIGTENLSLKGFLYVHMYISNVRSSDTEEGYISLCSKSAEAKGYETVCNKFINGRNDFNDRQKRFEK